MKPRIFIGSSSEGLKVAERVKAFFEPDYDCYLWTDDIFKNNMSFLETLMKSASLFDFGLMVFSADDESKVRDKFFETPRDNVLFEYGLFLGRMGVNRAFIVAEKEAKIPSDLFGITQTRYEVKTIAQGEKVATDSLEKDLEKLKRQIDENLKLGHLGLLPSTVIAMSYFEGFVKIVAEWIIHNIPKIKLREKEYKESTLFIRIPEKLGSDAKTGATLFYKKHGLYNEEITSGHRSYPVHVAASEENGVLEIYDMPTILSCVSKAIDLYFGVEHIGKSAQQELAEVQELNNFKRVLQLLIDGDECCREYVKIID